MSLQRRLILFFVVIVVLPLAAAGLVVQRLVVGEVTSRSAMTLGAALDAATLVYNERSSMLAEVVGSVVEPRALAEALAPRERTELDSLLGAGLFRADHLDFLVVADPNGKVLGSALGPDHFLPGFELPDEEELVAENGPGFAKVELPVMGSDGSRQGVIVGGFWLDADLLVPVGSEEVDLSVVSGRRVIASTLPLPRPENVALEAGDEQFETTLGDDVLAQARRLDGAGPVALVASSPLAPTAAISTRVMGSILGLLLLAVLGTTVLAVLLARLITRPLEELALGAEAVSEGHFDHRIPVRSRDEVGRLAMAFNEMTGRLRGTITELQDSHDLLQRAVQRVGETLRSTHDMTQLLEAILDTAADAVDADAAVLWRFTSNRDELYPALIRGVPEEDVRRVKVGEGVVGLVAERATRVMLPSTTVSVRPSRKEPARPVAIAVPVHSRDRLTAVLSVYREDGTRPFTREDLDAVFFLAEQGGVAIENVLLHEEAQRLSLIDGLTGIYNRRYFQMQFRQLLATAMRFERPFSVLMLDLDEFKPVNDKYGHQRGDSILVEVSQRVAGTLREIDTFARYGGEEFIALLPETGLPGGLATANKILEVIRNEPFGAADEDQVTITVSIGVACYPEHGDSFTALVEAADQALYVAKQEGRNRAAPAGEPPSGLRLA